MEHTSLERFSWDAKKYILEKEIEDLEVTLRAKRKELEEGMFNWLNIFIEGELIPIKECEIKLSIFEAKNYDPYAGDNTYNVINSFYIKHKETTLRIFPIKQKDPDWISSYSWDGPKEIRTQYTKIKKELTQIEAVLCTLSKNRKDL